MKLINKGNIFKLTKPLRTVFSYVHYRINNIATTIIKTTKALNVPPTATGVTFESTFMWSAFISKKKREKTSITWNDYITTECKYTSTLWSQQV